MSQGKDYKRRSSICGRWDWQHWVWHVQWNMLLRFARRVKAVTQLDLEETPGRANRHSILQLLTLHFTLNRILLSFQLRFYCCSLIWKLYCISILIHSHRFEWSTTRPISSFLNCLCNRLLKPLNYDQTMFWAMMHLIIRIANHHRSVSTLFVRPFVHHVI